LKPGSAGVLRHYFTDRSRALLEGRLLGEDFPAKFNSRLIYKLVIKTIITIVIINKCRKVIRIY
jgi:hypothetical protein